MPKYTTKECFDCKELKATSEFSKYAWRQPHGRCSVCRRKESRITHDSPKSRRAGAPAFDSKGFNHQCDLFFAKRGL